MKKPIPEPAEASDGWVPHEEAGLLPQEAQHAKTEVIGHAPGAHQSKHIVHNLKSAVVIIAIKGLKILIFNKK